MTSEERRQYYREWRRKHPDYYRAIYRKRKKWYAQYGKQWRRDHPGYERGRYNSGLRKKPATIRGFTRQEYHRRYNAKYYRQDKERIKVWARYTLRNAIARGTIQSESCAQCMLPKAEAHHPDYTSPYDVIWLCRPHHRKLHTSLKSNS